MLENEIENINNHNNKIIKMLKSIDTRVLMSAYLACGASTMTNMELRDYVNVFAVLLAQSAVDSARDVWTLNKEKNEMVKRLTLY